LIPRVRVACVHVLWTGSYVSDDASGGPPLTPPITTAPVDVDAAASL
jgi:hypothetical protein